VQLELTLEPGRDDGIVGGKDDGHASGGAQLERVVGRIVLSVDHRGKHLLIEFDNGLTLHTHLGLHGSWSRFRPGEMWRRSPARLVPGQAAFRSRRCTTSWTT